jgi:hypothetical protein
VQAAYQALVGRDRAVTRAEFWRMSPDEVWWLIEARQKESPNSEAEAEAARERAADYKAEAEAAGFQTVGEFWRWRAKQRGGHG